jgi:hypothetical protein
MNGEKSKPFCVEISRLFGHALAALAEKVHRHAPEPLPLKLHAAISACVECIVSAASAAARGLKL